MPHLPFPYNDANDHGALSSDWPKYFVYWEKNGKCFKCAITVFPAITS